MKTLRSNSGPFSEQPYFTPEEFERICSDELQKAGLYPDKPEPIRIERFIEKRFNVSPRYEDMPEGVLGYTRFGSQGVESIIVSRALSEEQTVVSRRRVNTTLAHEAGHGLLHAYLFALAASQDVAPLFSPEYDVESQRILCRDAAIAGGAQGASGSRYSGRWWEFQANKAMGTLLLPRDLVVKCLDGILVPRGSFGEIWIAPGQREAAAHKLTSAFDVNPVVGRLRLGELFPQSDEQQLTF
jgi:hypothetical protein